MGFKQRERKRRQKAAMQAAQKQSRETGSSRREWWLTIVRSDLCCARCAGMLRKDRPMVYRAMPREALCVFCADSEKISYRPSMSWETRRRSTG